SSSARRTRGSASRGRRSVRARPDRLGPAPDSLPSIAGELGDAGVAEAQVGGRVVPLGAADAGLGLVAVAAVVGGGAGVGPVGDLIPVDPDGEVVVVRHDGLGEPREVVGHDLPRRLAAIDGAGTIVDGLRPVVPLILVADLRLVAAPELAGEGAEEDAAV